MSEERWIDEQKKFRFLEGGNTVNDAYRMLEYGEINRVHNIKMSRRFTSARFIGDCLGIGCINDLCTMLEKSQMCISGESRSNFMKVAIEQWQGKLANARARHVANTLENLS